jgi:hypothetical protein
MALNLHIYNSQTKKTSRGSPIVCEFYLFLLIERIDLIRLN